MLVYYGGLQLRLSRIMAFDRQPVLDETGTDYLFTKVTIQAMAIVNSQVMEAGAAFGMSYVKDTTSPESVPPFVREQWAGGNPVLTDTAIRHWLSVPRRQLIVVAGPNHDVLLASPKSGRFCDAHNGPVCDVYSIQEALGDAKTFIVQLQLTTYINECEEAENKLAVLLSNRFEQRHELDEDYGLTVITTGTAHFRTDLVYDQTFGFPVNNPDQIRPYIFLPVPYGFKRHIDFVRGYPDSSAIDYQFRDVQQPYQFVVGDEIGATRVEANYREALVSGENPLGTVLNNVERYWNMNWLRNQNKGGRDDPAEAPSARPRKKGKAKGRKLR